AGCRLPARWCCRRFPACRTSDWCTPCPRGRTRSGPWTSRLRALPRAAWATTSSRPGPSRSGRPPRGRSRRRRCAARRWARTPLRGRRASPAGRQRGGGHDLPRLAVAALRHVFLDPRALHGVRAVLGEAFDRSHPFAGDGGHGQHAGACRDAVQVDGAGAALGDAAAELGAGEPERVTQHPEERRVGGDVDRFALPLTVKLIGGMRGVLAEDGNNVYERTRGWKGGRGRGSLFIYRAP